MVTICYMQFTSQESLRILSISVKNYPYPYPIHSDVVNCYPYPCSTTNGLGRVLVHHITSVTSLNRTNTEKARKRSDNTRLTSCYHSHKSRLTCSCTFRHLDFHDDHIHLTFPKFHKNSSIPLQEALLTVPDNNIAYMKDMRKQQKPTESERVLINNATAAETCITPSQ